MSVVYPGSELLELIDDIHHYTHHVSNIFPELTDETVLVTAGGVVDTFGAWAAVVDNNAVELSTVFAADDGHLVSVLIEDCNRTDERYLLEISYGAAHVVIGRTRFMKAAVFLDVSQQTRIRSIHVPAGETVYYRMMCETALATASVHFRYYTI